jgi:hypothetical protein
MRWYEGAVTWIDQETLVVKDGEWRLVELEGVWRLPMIGAEQALIRQAFADEVGAGEITDVYTDGAYLLSPDGSELVQVLERFPSTPEKRRGYTEKDFFPTYLPEEAALGVSVGELMRFQGELASESALSDGRGVTEKTDALIIGALLQYIRGEFKGAKAHPSFKSQAQLILDFEAHFKGVRGLGESTFENRFGKANKAVQEAEKELAKRPK